MADGQDVPFDPEVDHIFFIVPVPEGEDPDIGDVVDLDGQLAQIVNLVEDVAFLIPVMGVPVEVNLN